MRKRIIILTAIGVLGASSLLTYNTYTTQKAEAREEMLKQAEKERIEKIIYEQNKKAFEKMKQEVEDQKEQDRLDRLEELRQAEIEKLEKERLEKERLDSLQVLYVSSTKGLNVRLEPNNKSEKIKTLALNTKLNTYRVVGNKDWKQIEIDGKVCYVHNSYLSKEKTVIAKPKPVAQKPNNTNTVNNSTNNSNNTSSSTPSKPSHTPSNNTSSGTYLGKYQLTAYCNCSKCCGQWSGGATASGAMPQVGVTVASNSIPLGTRIHIEGYGTYTVQDTGGMANNVIDIYFGSHEQALAFGRKHGVKVYRK